MYLKYIWIIDIPTYDGIKEEIGRLDADKTHIDELCDLPIDIRMLHLKKLN